MSHEARSKGVAITTLEIVVKLYLSLDQTSGILLQKCSGPVCIAKKVGNLSNFFAGQPTVSGCSRFAASMNGPLGIVQMAMFCSNNIVQLFRQIE